MVFPFGSETFGGIAMDFRLNIYREAAVNNIDLITTLVFEAGKSDAFTGQITDAVEGNGGKILWVKVNCPRDILMQRATSRSRMGHDKLTDPVYHKNLLDNLQLQERAPFVESHEIDSSLLSPFESAEKMRSLLNN